jgi:hypothetical protein
MTGYRFHVGRDVIVVRDDESGVEVEGRSRLPPGRVVRLTGVAGAARNGRLAVVTTWRVIRLGHSAGPTYRGYCEWLHTARDAPIRR